MIPDRFQSIIEKLKHLSSYERYRGAFIFGSIARNEADEKSDVDVKVVIAENNPCTEINHPFIDGIKLDLTFVSLEQIEEQYKESQNRMPMLAESIVLFDKDGELTKLKEKLSKEKPPALREEDFQLQQFLIHHADDKVRRNLDVDPASALLSMGIGINDIVKIHYQLHEKWWVSNKRLLKDLQSWDPVLTVILRSFLLETNLQEKYKYWVEIIEHVTIPMGGRQKIEDNNCECEQCKADIDNVMN